MVSVCPARWLAGFGVVALVSVVANVSGESMYGGVVEGRTFGMFVAQTTLGNIRASESDILDGKVARLWINSIVDALITLGMVYLVHFGRKTLANTQKATDSALLSMRDYTLYIRQKGLGWGLMDFKKADWETKTADGQVKPAILQLALQYYIMQVKDARLAGRRVKVACHPTKAGTGCRDQVAEESSAVVAGNHTFCPKAMWLIHKDLNNTQLWEEEVDRIYELETAMCRAHRVRNESGQGPAFNARCR
eukprot:SAG22_NODE_1780_length_3600_cov_1.391888_2_plen_250_part_00